MIKTILNWSLFLFLAGSGILLIVALFCEIAYFLFESEMVAAIRGQGRREK